MCYLVGVDNIMVFRCRMSWSRKIAPMGAPIRMAFFFYTCIEANVNLFGWEIQKGL